MLRVFSIIGLLVLTLSFWALEGCRCGQEAGEPTIITGLGSDTGSVADRESDDVAPDADASESANDAATAESGDDVAPRESGDDEAPSGGEAASSVPRPVPVDRFALVVRIEKQAYLVLHDRPETSWASGAPRLVREKRPVGVEVDVDLDAVPAEVPRPSGAQVVIHRRSSSASCKAMTGSLVLVRRMVPNIWDRMRWLGKRGATPSAADKAVTAWEFDIPGLSENLPDGRLFVAKIVGMSPACVRAEDLTWGHLAEARVPGIFSDRRPARPLREDALARFRALPDAALNEETLAASGDSLESGGGVWGSNPRSPVQIREWRREGSEQRFVTVVGRGDDGPCGGQVGTKWALFEVVGSELRLLWTQVDGFWMAEDITIFDLDEDGRPEILRPPGRLFVPTDEGYQIVETAEWPDFDASC